MTTVEQDTLAASSIGPTSPSAAYSDVHIKEATTLASEIGSMDSEWTRRTSAALSLINIVKIVTCSRAPPIVLVTLLDIISSSFPSDQEIWDCVHSDHPTQIGITQFASLLHLLERAVDRLSTAIAVVTGDLATMTIPALRLPWHYMVRVSLPSGRAHWSAAQLLLKSAIQLLTPLTFLAADGAETFVSFSSCVTMVEGPPCIGCIVTLLEKCSVIKIPEEIDNLKDSGLSLLRWVIALPRTLIARMITGDEFDYTELLQFGKLNPAFTIEGALLKLSHWYRNGFLAGFESETIDLILIHPLNSQLSSTLKVPSGRGGLAHWRNVGFSSGSTLSVLDTPAKWISEQIRTAVIVRLLATFETVSWNISQDARANIAAPNGAKYCFARHVILPSSLKGVLADSMQTDAEGYEIEIGSGRIDGPAIGRKPIALINSDRVAFSVGPGTHVHID